MDFAGFGIRGFRSFGDLTSIERLGPMQKIHLVVGRNNVGKSNALNFMHGTVAALRMKPDLLDFFTGELDTPDGWPTATPRIVSIGLYRTAAVDEALRIDLGSAGFAPYFDTEAYTCGLPGTVWLDFEATSSMRGWTLSPSLDQFNRAAQQIPTQVARSDLRDISVKFTGGASGDQDNLEGAIGRLNWAQFIPETTWVDAVREIAPPPESGKPSGLRNGRGLIPDLAILQNPGHKEHAISTAKFSSLQAFVRAVLDDERARIEIPRGDETILVHSGEGLVKPLDALGTGIGEVIILAAVSTLHSNRLICIEEPEVHLHPTLQRLLIQYLDAETDNRYLISTHSAALLDAERASISHAVKDGEWTSIRHVGSAASRSHAVSDLGNRASDLVQSNFVVWVEGPSDRIYISHWLEKMDPTLIEGAHYSIMFYGGSLLNHLSADDEETNELIDLLYINRNLAVVIDSDRSFPNAPLNATKRRVIAEVEKIKAQVWVTEGYTMENYLPGQLLDDVIKQKYPESVYSRPTDQTCSPLGSTFKGTTSKPSKVTIARAVANRNMDISEWSSDLRAQVERMARDIRASNGLVPVLPNQSEPTLPR